MNNWDDIRIFLAVAEGGNLTAAARALSLTQPSVGRRIAALEQRLGTPLFLRSGRQWALTDFGRDLAAQAAVMQQAADVIIRKSISRTEGASGLVRLTSTDGLGAYWLPGLLPDLAGRLPDITLEILTGNRPLDLTRQGADIALRLYRPTEDDLVVRLLGKVAFALYAAPSYLDRYGCPEGLDDLNRHRFIGQALDYDNVTEFAWLRRHVAEPDFAFRSGSSVAQAQAALQGVGIALLPRYLATAIGGLREIALPEKVDGKEIWLAAHRDLRKVPKVAALWDFLKGRAQTDPLLLERPDRL